MLNYKTIYSLTALALLSSGVSAIHADPSQDVSIDLVMNNYAQVTVSSSSVTLEPDESNFALDEITNNTAFNVFVRTNDTTGAKLTVKAAQGAGRTGTNFIQTSGIGDLMIRGSAPTGGSTIISPFGSYKTVTTTAQDLWNINNSTTAIDSLGKEQLTIGVKVRNLGFYSGATPGGSGNKKTYSNTLTFTAIPNPS